MGHFSVYHYYLKHLLVMSGFNCTVHTSFLKGKLVFFFMNWMKYFMVIDYIRKNLKEYKSSWYLISHGTPNCTLFMESALHLSIIWVFPTGIKHMTLPLFVTHSNRQTKTISQRFNKWLQYYCYDIGCGMDACVFFGWFSTKPQSADGSLTLTHEHTKPLSSCLSPFPLLSVCLGRWDTRDSLNVTTTRA